MTVFTDLDGDKNVLSAEVLKKLFLLRKKLVEINTEATGHESTWEKTCSRQRVSRGGGRGGGGGVQKDIISTVVLCHVGATG